jgi:hypothetical protein
VIGDTMDSKTKDYILKDVEIFYKSGLWKRENRTKHRVCGIEECNEQPKSQSSKDKCIRPCLFENTNIGYITNHRNDECCFSVDNIKKRLITLDNAVAETDW